MVQNPIQEGDGDPRHGTRGGYINHGCRCAECTQANTDGARVYMRRRRRQLGMRTRAQWRADLRKNRQPCGTNAGYARHKKNGKRACRPCKDAAADYRRELRAAA